VGAEVYATASESKRDFIRALGVKHVFDSRSLDFVDGVRSATDGAGVDVVLNSLAGDFIPASIGTLAPYGRFVEIGKRDIFSNAKLGLWPFRNNLSYFAVDMDRVFRDRPAIGAGLLDDVRRGVAEGTYRPLSFTSYPIASAVTAFRFLASGRHIGKVVLSFTEAPKPAEGLAAAGGGDVAFAADVTYLVTGGLRGLGGRVAEWMATRGARNLVLVGRDPSSEAARETARRIEALGARATLLAADMAQPEQVAAVLDQIRASLPPLRGIVHGAGVLADASVLNLDDDAVLRVFGPKAAGAINLHRATQGEPLDFFVSFSSMASVMGNPGQANYSAANALLDRLAWLRAAEGHQGQTINWGPWAEIGMSATAEGQRFGGVGVGTIAPAKGIEALEQVMGRTRGLPADPQVLVLRIDWPRFVSMVPGAKDDPFLARIRANIETGGGERARGEPGAALTSLLAAPEEERLALLERFVQNELAKVLELEPDDLPLDQPLNTVGLDSLMALELKNRVEVALSITLPIVSLIQGPTISQLAEDLLARVEAAAGLEAGEGASIGTAGANAGAAASADGAPSADEIATLLSRSTGSKSRPQA
jgi:NAD(P)-dependent dehydrogenase (short-subunit alcohol dehydrogenase family)/acyl carrier protein